MISDFVLCIFFKVAALSNDPLAWKGGLKAQWAMAIHDAMEHIKENLPKIEWPFIVLHGDADQLTMVEGSMMLEEKASSKDKTIKVMCIFFSLSTRLSSTLILTCTFPFFLTDLSRFLPQAFERA